MKKEEFLTLFKQIANNSKSLKENWTNSNYTETMKNEVLKKIVENKLKYIFEYWKIDCVYFDKTDIYWEDRRGTWLKKISIMIEHENDNRRAFEEINKLCLWRAELKVLITYYKKEDEVKKLIIEWSDLMSKMLNNIENENYLIIFGNDEKTEFDKFYEWDNNEKRLIPIS
jgi:hypothetical protein